MIKSDKGMVEIEGMTIDLIVELRCIGVSARKMFAKDFGEEKANKLVDAVFSDDSNTNSAKNIVDILESYSEKEEKPVTSGDSALDLLIEAIFGRGDK